MRDVTVQEIRSAVRDLCIQANRVLPESLAACLGAHRAAETDGGAAQILAELEENLRCAQEIQVPICQDTGMAVVFAQVGQEVRITGGGFEEAVHQGVRDGYVEGLLRCSVVRDPLFDRVNTDDNTPAVLHTRIVPGDTLKLEAAPKGFGSENMSRMKMFTPAASSEDIQQFVLETAELAGGNPCPPMVIGVGIGGDFEYCAYLAKKALCRDVAVRHKEPAYARMEEALLEAINATGIGPQGFGGRTTALAVNIETYPTHIAGLPVAVNVGCHVTRHASVVL